MQQTPISGVWLDKLYELSLFVKFQKDIPHKEDIIKLYRRLSDDEKNSPIGQSITTNLYPPKVIKEGENIVDTDLFDLQGNIHHLNDLKGKYLLIDFWTAGCGPCIRAIPEMAQINNSGNDRLALVSINCDSENIWQKVSQDHNITWLNLYDKKRNSGIYAKYGVLGFPYYILISPEGKIIKKWLGYSPGSLKMIVDTYINSKMSIAYENDKKIVNAPSFESSNNNIIRIMKIELTDTATIVHIKAYYTPNYWIQLNSNVHINDQNNTKYPFKHSEGFQINSKVNMPENGEKEFTLFFAPIPKDSEYIDFKESENKNDWTITRIKLFE